MQPPPTRIESPSIGSADLTTDAAGLLSRWTKTGAILTTHRWVMVMGGLTAASVVILVVCLQFGATSVEMKTVVGAILKMFRTEQLDASGIGTPGVIMVQIRFPRVLMGFLIGGSLAGIGVTLQALLRNPLADPYVLGVSSGAALGVSLALLFGVGTTFALLPVLPLLGFIGGFLSLVLIYRFAQSQGRLPVHSLLLAGVILNAIVTALIMFITSIMEPNRSAGLMAWLMGSLTAPGYPALAVFLLYMLVVLAILIRKAHVLNVLTLGEEATVRTDGAVDRRRRFVQWDDRICRHGDPAHGSHAHWFGSSPLAARLYTCRRDVPRCGGYHRQNSAGSVGTSGRDCHRAGRRSVLLVPAVIPKRSD